MTMHYDFWMALGTLAVAIGAVFGCARLAVQLRAAQRAARCALIAAPVLSLALWTLSFGSVFVARGLTPSQLDLPLALLAVESALIACAVAMWLGRQGDLRGMRLPGAVAALVAGALSTRYFVIAALHLVPAPIFNITALAPFTLGAAAAAFAAFGFAARWFSSPSPAVRLSAAALSGLALWFLHVWCLPPGEVSVDPFQHATSADVVALAYAACAIVIALLAALSLLQARPRDVAIPDRRLAG